MIEFSIHGNHENKNGNPLPKHRLTRRQQWSDKAERYHEYLDYVRAAFIDAVHKQGKISGREKFIAQHLTFASRKPLGNTGDEKWRMEIFITWGSKAHGDPENIFGAIADAIFEQDKYLAGSFDFDERIGKSGRVDVRIWKPSATEKPGSAGSSLHSRPRVKVAKQRDPLLSPKRRKTSPAR